VPWCVRPLLHPDLTGADGAHDHAAELALQAFTGQCELRDMVDALPSLLCAGRAVAAAGRRDEAVTELRRLAELAEGCEAWRFREAAAAELRRLGIRLPRPAGSTGTGSVDELTERERDIAALVAEGRTNKQVAAALFLSEKTIEHYLSRVYTKLGVRSRGELAAAWPDRTQAGGQDR
jgi:DNA-binding NarL/FixJ family response regulator